MEIVEVLLWRSWVYSIRIQIRTRKFFKCYSEKYTTPSKPKFVSLEEFIEIVLNSNILKLKLQINILESILILIWSIVWWDGQWMTYAKVYSWFYESIARIEGKKIYVIHNKGRKDTQDTLFSIQLKLIMSSMITEFRSVWRLYS